MTNNLIEEIMEMDLTANEDTILVCQNSISAFLTDSVSAEIILLIFWDILEKYFIFE